MWVIGICCTAAGPAKSGSSNFAFVTTTDYITGSSACVDLYSPYTGTANVASIHSDATARVYDELIYVVNRAGADNIQILDPSTNFSTVRQVTVGGNSDPHDIVVVGPTKAYVTRYNETDLWIVDPSTGAQTGSVDLSSLADADGIPEMDSMVLVGNRLFVTIQRLDRNNFFAPVGTSYVAVIDITTDTLVDVDLVTAGVQPITLTGADPFSSIQYPYNGHLYVSTVGFFGLLDGGGEFIDPVTLQSTGFFVTEATMGGDINDIEIVAVDKGYCVVSDASFNTILKAFNPQTGANLGTVFNPGGFVLYDIEESPIGGEIFVTDRTVTNPGIRIFDVSTDTEVAGSPVSTGLPPFDIAFSVSVQTGIDGGAPPAASLGQNYPNPFNPVTTIPFSLERSGHATLRIFDVKGSLVRTLIDRVMLAGPGEAVWDGFDEASHAVATGVYFARLEASGQVFDRKLVLLK
jgi:hypothetical protein